MRIKREGIIIGKGATVHFYAWLYEEPRVHVTGLGFQRPDGLGDIVSALRSGNGDLYLLLTAEWC